MVKKSRENLMCSTQEHGKPVTWSALFSMFRLHLFFFFKASEILHILGNPDICVLWSNLGFWGQADGCVLGGMGS